MRRIARVTITHLVQEVDDLVERVGALAVLKLLVVEDLRFLDEIALAEIRIRISVLRRLIKVVACSFAHLSFYHFAD